MSQLDEKLNQLLGDPAAMAQVMQLAQQLSGTLGEGGGGGSPHDSGWTGRCLPCRSPIRWRFC